MFENDVRQTIWQRKRKQKQLDKKKKGNNMKTVIHWQEDNMKTTIIAPRKRIGFKMIRIRQVNKTSTRRRQEKIKRR